MSNTLSKEQFQSLFDKLQVRKDIDCELVFEAFTFAIDAADKLSSSNVLGKATPINPIAMVLYLVNEFGFYLETHEVTCKELAEDDNAMSQIVSFAVDKYFTNEHLKFENTKVISKFSPLISNLDIYLNFILGVLGKFERHNPRETLLLDVMYKGFSIAKAVSGMVVDGFETEAFSLWRTLHENECILSLLDKYGDQVVNSYLKHIDYGRAFRGGFSSKETTDKIFGVMKGEMKNLDLKSKDMKKYIEYGWLSAIPEYNKDSMFKFNFRDGVERLSGLNAYSKLYEMASEISHSSPILIYSRNEYYFHLSILCVYESFFRLEEIFANFYRKNALDEDVKRYLVLRGAYYPILQTLYRRERDLFKQINQPNK